METARARLWRLKELFFGEEVQRRAFPNSDSQTDQKKERSERLSGYHHEEVSTNMVREDGQVAERRKTVH